jgi:hypothetical protein
MEGPQWFKRRAGPGGSARLSLETQLVARALQPVPMFITLWDEDCAGWFRFAENLWCTTKIRGARKRSRSFDFASRDEAARSFAQDYNPRKARMTIL